MFENLKKYKPVGGIDLSNEAVLSKDQKKVGWWGTQMIAFKKNIFLQALLLPGLIYYIVFHYFPIYGLLIAFKDYNPRLGVWASEWAANGGFEHFVRFFSIPNVWNYIWNTIILSVLHIVWLFPLSIILALFLNEVNCAWYKKLVQTISYLPHFVSVAAVAGMLTMFLSSQGGPGNNGGIINQMLVNMGLISEGIPFLDQTRWFRTIYIGSDVWSSIGWSAIIYIAALSGVDQELYEAATIDGATRVQKMWHISVQMIRPTIITLLIMQIGKIMSLGSEKALLLQRESTMEVSEILSTYIYNQGLGNGYFDYSAAVGLFNSLINVLLVFAANIVSRKLTETSLW